MTINIQFKFFYKTRLFMTKNKINISKKVSEDQIIKIKIFMRGNLKMINFMVKVYIKKQGKKGCMKDFSKMD